MSVLLHRPRSEAERDQLRSPRSEAERDRLFFLATGQFWERVQAACKDQTHRL